MLAELRQHQQATPARRGGRSERMPYQIQAMIHGLNGRGADGSEREQDSTSLDNSASIGAVSEPAPAAAPRRTLADYSDADLETERKKQSGIAFRAGNFGTTGDKTRVRIKKIEVEQSRRADASRRSVPAHPMSEQDYRAASDKALDARFRQDDMRRENERIDKQNAQIDTAEQVAANAPQAITSTPDGTEAVAGGRMLLANPRSANWSLRTADNKRFLQASDIAGPDGKKAKLNRTKIESLAQALAGIQDGKGSPAPFAAPDSTTWSAGFRDEEGHSIQGSIAKALQNWTAGQNLSVHESSTFAREPIPRGRPVRTDVADTGGFYPNQHLAMASPGDEIRLPDGSWKTLHHAQKESVGSGYVDKRDRQFQTTMHFTDNTSHAFDPYSRHIDIRYADGRSPMDPTRLQDPGMGFTTGSGMGMRLEDMQPREARERREALAGTLEPGTRILDTRHADEPGASYDDARPKVGRVTNRVSHVEGITARVVEYDDGTFDAVTPAGLKKVNASPTATEVNEARSAWGLPIEGEAPPATAPKTGGKTATTFFARDPAGEVHSINSKRAVTHARFVGGPTRDENGQPLGGYLATWHGSEDQAVNGSGQAAEWNRYERHVTPVHRDEESARLAAGPTQVRAQGGAKLTPGAGAPAPKSSGPPPGAGAPAPKSSGPPPDAIAATHANALARMNDRQAQAHLDTLSRNKLRAIDAEFTRRAVELGRPDVQTPRHAMVRAAERNATYEALTPGEAADNLESAATERTTAMREAGHGDEEIGRAVDTEARALAAAQSSPHRSAANEHTTALGHLIEQFADGHQFGAQAALDEHAAGTMTPEQRNDRADHAERASRILIQSGVASGRTNPDVANQLSRYAEGLRDPERAQSHQRRHPQELPISDTSRITPEALDEASALRDLTLGLHEDDDGHLEVEPEVAARQDRVSSLLDQHGSGKLALTDKSTDELHTHRRDLTEELRLQEELARRPGAPAGAVASTKAPAIRKAATEAPQVRPGLAGAAQDHAEALRSGDAEAIARTRTRLDSSVRRSRAGSSSARALADHLGEGGPDAEQLDKLAGSLKDESRARRNATSRARRTAKRLDRERIRSVLGSVEGELRSRGESPEITAEPGAPRPDAATPRITDDIPNSTAVPAETAVTPLTDEEYDQPTRAIKPALTPNPAWKRPREAAATLSDDQRRELTDISHTARATYAKRRAAGHDHDPALTLAKGQSLTDESVPQSRVSMRDSLESQAVARTGSVPLVHGGELSRELDGARQRLRNMRNTNLASEPSEPTRGDAWRARVAPHQRRVAALAGLSSLHSTSGGTASLTDNPALMSPARLQAQVIALEDSTNPDDIKRLRALRRAAEKRGITLT